MEKLRLHEEMGLEDNEEEETNESDDEEESEVGEEEEYREDVQLREKGPAILSSCSRDLHDDMPVPWVARYTSNYTNKNERILVMRSNIWPGAYSFVYEQLCDSIYLGWGHKYVARNMNWPHIPLVSEEYPHGCKDFVEIDDPSVELEEAYRLSLLKELKLANVGENLSEYENETYESSDNEDEDEDEEEEEEEEEEE